MRTEWLTKRKLNLLAVALLACIAMTVPASSEVYKPIIAHLFAEPKTYDTKTVTVYGLVVETWQKGSVFLLQDVSQMPLKVERYDGVETTPGDQLLVEGVFHRGIGDPKLDAIKIVPTKVLGGGGCC